MKGEGIFAELLSQRFKLAIKRLDLNRRGDYGLDCSQFCPPGAQMNLL